MNQGNEMSIKLTDNDILEKEFPIDTRGYRMVEVDKYLDIIRGDYKTFNIMNKKCIGEVERLIRENDELRKEITRLKEGLSLFKNSSKEVTNIDIIRRLSQLEKAVYDSNK